jgi:hypothetical protein
VLVVGREAPSEVMELVELSRSPAFAQYFAARGAIVSQRFADMNVPLPDHGSYVAPPIWRRVIDKAKRGLRRFGQRAGA